MKAQKVLCLIFAVMILASLCACGENVTPSGTQMVVTGPATSGTTTTPEPSSAPASDDEFSVGATVSNTYENKYFGIGVTLDENWTFATQEEINETNGIVQDVLDNDTYTKALESGAVYTDMIAKDTTGLLNLNAGIEKLNAVNTLVLDEEKYVEASLQNTDFKTIFENMGYDITTVEQGTATLAGKSHPCIIIEGNIQGVSFYEKVVAIKKGNYVVCITASSFTENVVDRLLAAFYAL